MCRCVRASTVMCYYVPYVRAALLGNLSEDLICTTPLIEATLLIGKEQSLQGNACDPRYDLAAAQSRSVVDAVYRLRWPQGSILGGGVCTVLLPAAGTV